VALITPTRSIERMVAAALILGVAASPIPYLPLNVFGWLAILPVVLLPALRSVAARVVVLLLVVSGGFQLIVDLTLAVPLEDLAKGVARYGGILFPLLGCLWAIERRLLDRHEVSLLHGIGWLVGAVVFFEPGPGHGLWKYGLLAPVSLIAVALFTRRWISTQSKVWLLALLPVAAVSLFTDTRVTAIELVLALLLSLVATHSDSSGSIRIVLISTVFILLFSASANAGVFGEAIQAKWQKQGESPLSVLVVGRPEFSFSIAALSVERFSPHGSESISTARAYAAGAAGIIALPEPEKNAVLDRLVSTELDLHSVIATAAWQGGAPCGLAFAVIFVLVVRRAVGLRSEQVKTLGPVYVYSMLVILWDFLFSPWTYFTGATWGIMLGIVFASERAKK